MNDIRRSGVMRLHLLGDNENDKDSKSPRRPGLPGRNRSGGPGNSKGRPRIPPWVIAVLFLGLVAYQLYAIFDPQRDAQSITVPYSVVEQQVRAGNVTEVTLTDANITAELEEPVAWDRQTEQLVTPAPDAEAQGIVEGDSLRATLPPVENTGLLPLLEQNEVVVKGESDSSSLLSTLVVTLLPFLLIVGLIIFMGRQMSRGQQNVFGFGRSRAKQHDPERPQVTFADVAGEDEGQGPDFDKALGDRDPARASVLLAHQPIQIHDAVDHKVDLQLSGHTHGGQMWPGTLLAELANPTVAGLERYGDTQLYVTRGAGFWGPPVRVGAPPDITVVELAAPRA